MGVTGSFAARNPRESAGQRLAARRQVPGIGWGSIPDLAIRIAHGVVRLASVRPGQSMFRYAECWVEGYDSPRRVELGGIEPGLGCSRVCPGHSVFRPPNTAGGSNRGSNGYEAVTAARVVASPTDDRGHRWTTVEERSTQAFAGAASVAVHRRPLAEGVTAGVATWSALDPAR